MLALDQLLTQLKRHQPANLLFASKHPLSMVQQLSSIQQFVAHHHCHLTEIFPTENNPTTLPQKAFGIIIDYLEHLDKAVAARQLAQWRNLHCNHIWLAVDAENSQWRFNDFIALGFQRLGQVTHPIENLNDEHKTHKGDRQLEVYGYDLDHYIRRRDWNNSRYWANPQRWTKR